MVTIKQIADLCGVSRGTVDRVINERGNVKPETKELVLSMAKELGYKPNPAGKALSARKKNPVVGVVISSEGNPFFDDVIRGIKLAAEKYEIYGLKVIWKNMRGYDVKSQHEIMEELKDKVNALIINPVNDPVIINEINERINEDPLRMLRAVRFATVLGFKIEENLYEELKKNKEFHKKSNRM